MLKLLIFDLDGTLLDTLQDLAASCNAALRLHGFPERSLDEVRSFVGHGTRKLMERALPAEASEDALEQVFASFTAHYKVHLADTTEPYPGMIEALQTLKASGYTLGMLSNKPDPAVKVLAEAYFPGIFLFAIGESEEVPKKPDPTGLLTMIRQSGFERDQALYIGDSEPDALTAQAAGVASLGVLWGFRSKEALEAAGMTAFVRTPQTLPERIEALNL